MSSDITHPAHLREGDLIFTRIPNPVYRRIAEATGAETSHVGILFKGEDGGWRVAESKVPFARYSMLENFIGRSADGWHVVRRLRRPLTPDDITALRLECDKRMGALYHSGFRYASKRTFCSKFAHEVFRSALGVNVGKLQTFAQLLQQRPGTALAFWKIWFFGRIPWSRITVTPASQLEDPGLLTIFESHPAPDAAHRQTRLGALLLLFGLLTLGMGICAAAFSYDTSGFSLLLGLPVTGLLGLIAVIIWQAFQRIGAASQPAAPKPGAAPDADQQ